MLTVTPIYVVIAIVIYSALTYPIIRHRMTKRLSLGDGGDAAFNRKIRAHGNFAEYVPLILIAMGAAELIGAPFALLHASGIALTVGRSLHGYSLAVAERGILPRVSGMMLTLLSLWLAGAAVVWGMIV